MATSLPVLGIRKAMPNAWYPRVVAEPLSRRRRADLYVRCEPSRKMPDHGVVFLFGQDSVIDHDFLDVAVGGMRIAKTITSDIELGRTAGSIEWQQNFAADFSVTINKQPCVAPATIGRGR